MSDLPDNAILAGEPVVGELPVSSSKKRGRDAVPADEIEVDINAPEPPSKRAKRRAKKGKSTQVKDSRNPKTTFSRGISAPDPASSPSPSPSDFEDPALNGATTNSSKATYGVWIGNLPFTCTPSSLRAYLTTAFPSIPDATISRIHMPAPPPSAAPTATKPLNKGFAYVDFTTAEAQKAAIALSETQMGGRRLLIKSSNDFHGRPDRSTDAAGDGDGDGSKTAKIARGLAEGRGGHPPSRRVFVGNLGYDMTVDDVRHNFAPCGEILDVHAATFEDSGRSKGYAWVTFETVEAAEAAVRGWCKIKVEVDDSGNGESGEETEQKKKKKSQKWFVNRIHGRQIRCEFAEDSSVRYKRRFGKSSRDVPAADETNGDSGARLSRKNGDFGRERLEGVDTKIGSNNFNSNAKPDKAIHKDRSWLRQNEKRTDPRKIPPGAALARAQRGKMGAVEGQGTKITFD
ncbi:MAG: hypothetical protein M1822_000357 [Bathelium mastoideum]|nr:MAG: hypothetical protein M1822_000357 [Bathelium mastoideum]